MDKAEEVANTLNDFANQGYSMPSKHNSNKNKNKNKNQSNASMNALSNQQASSASGTSASSTESVVSSLILPASFTTLFISIEYFVILS